MDNWVDQSNETLWRLNMDASRKMKKLGFFCLAFCAVDILLSVLVSKLSLFTVIAVLICAATAIFDFQQSVKFARVAREYKQQSRYDM